ncbi:MAG TPA: neutral/alkaline non-lysosomal ceramidase N-terminal domain-containing protein, partial [Verrucomicrobiae bacterium]|nr:neutral/alkaline non-lysosomal ceramidase N-terminal domain-containing protein [Verrucomicrobiae bacterium]
MKPTKLLARWIFPGIFLFAALVTSANAAPLLNAGVAEIDITPPVGHRMAGYFDERLATGTHDSLKAKAFVLQQGSEKFAFAFCDLVGISLHVSTNARAQLGKVTGIPVSHVMICATHSHTGPSFDDVRRDYFHTQAMAKLGKDPQEEVYYPDFLTERLVKVLGEANSKIAPASVAVGIAHQEGLSFNRRYHMKNGKVAFNPGQLNPNIVKPAGPIDPDVPMLFFRNPETGKPFACLTVFACHCDTVGGTLFSADYPFFLQEAMRHEFGSDFISAFGAGTCGDINHINVAVKDPVKGFAMAERIGTTLGRTVLAAQKDLAVVARPRFAVESKTLTAPLQDVTPEQAKAAWARLEMLKGEAGSFMEKVEAVKAVDLASHGKTWPMEVQVFRLDNDTAMVGLPCEIFVELGLAIKQASPFKRTVVISICNDRPSYVPTMKAFGEGSYEVTNARVKPGAGEMMVAAAVELL